jgi:hypothetical protein
MEGENAHALTFTEEDMRAHAGNCAAEREAAQRRRPSRKQPANGAGGGWRVPMH